MGHLSHTVGSSQPQFVPKQLVLLLMFLGIVHLEFLDIVQLPLGSPAESGLIPIRSLVEPPLNSGGPELGTKCPECSLRNLLSIGGAPWS